MLRFLNGFINSYKFNPFIVRSTKKTFDEDRFRKTYNSLTFYCRETVDKFNYNVRNVTVDFSGCPRYISPLVQQYKVKP